MKYLPSIMQTIERENDVRVIFSDCSLTILKDYAINFILELEKYIEQNSYAHKFNKHNVLKAFVYLTIKTIAQRSDLEKFGITKIEVREL